MILRKKVVSLLLIFILCLGMASGAEASEISETEKNASHEANLLKLDCSKLKEAFGWHPRWRVEQAVEKTVEWTKVWLSGGDVEKEMDREIKDFIADM